MIREAAVRTFKYANFELQGLMLPDGNFAIAISEIARLISDSEGNVFCHQNISKEDFEPYCANLLKEKVLDTHIEGEQIQAYNLNDFEWLMEFFAMGGNKASQDYLIARIFSLKILMVLGKLTEDGYEELAYLRKEIEPWHKLRLAQMGDKAQVLNTTLFLDKKVSNLATGTAEKTKKGFVYLIQNQQTKNVKIGYSLKPSDRLKTLQASTDCELNLIASIKGDIALEQALHRKFKRFHLRNEWFEFSDSIAKFFGLKT